MTTSAIASANALTNRFDQPRIFGMGKGKISLKESGLSFTKRDTQAAFVRALSGLSDAEFSKATTDSALDDDAALAFIWNKYPEFAEKWDNGASNRGTKAHGRVCNGRYDYPFSAKQLVEDIETKIIEPRDRLLLACRPLLYHRGFGLPGSERAANALHQRLRVAIPVWQNNRAAVDWAAASPLPPAAKIF